VLRRRDLLRPHAQNEFSGCETCTLRAYRKDARSLRPSPEIQAPRLHKPSPCLSRVVRFRAGFCLTEESTRDETKAFLIAKQHWEHGRSAYAPTLRLSSTVVNRGHFRRAKDKIIRIGIRVSGYGRVTSAKLWVDMPIGLLDPSSPGKVWANVSAAPAPAGGLKPVIEKHGELDLNEHGFRIGLSVGLFLPDHPFPQEFPTPLIAGETVTAQGEWPITAEANVWHAALEGDYPINAVLTYHDGTDWQTATCTASVHVNSWMERWGRIVNPLTVILAAVGVISVIQAVLSLLSP